MTRPVDEKIVAMKMDNSDFVKKANETTGIFGKLKQSLNQFGGTNFNKVVGEFGNVQRAANSTDLSSLARSVEGISGRFSNLGIVATTALMNITNKAVDAGARILKSLTVDPPMDGFREYENKMSSIGTMLANTEWAGSTLDDVKKTLGELNDYADNTIYSFEQMTANVGRFTAAGVTLEDSAVAIKGLGNMAAVSGSSVDQLNTVMYQMSQALAAGKLNLMDWNSLVNGGMAGKKMQDALVTTAKAMGKNVDLSDGFRNSIEQGWLTSEVFLETLKKFGTDKSMTEAATSVRTFTGMIAALKEGIGSGWAETWELMFGDFEQATKRWTALSEVLGGFFKRSSDARNKFVKKLSDAGVFDALFKMVTGIGKAMLAILDAIGKGFSSAFSGVGDGVGTTAEAFVMLISALTPGKKTIEAISIIFQALFTVIGFVASALTGLAKIILILPLGVLKLLFDGILLLTGYLSDLAVAFTEGFKTGKNLRSTLGGLKGIFSSMGAHIKQAVKHISDFKNAIYDAWRIIFKSDFRNIGPWASENINKILTIKYAIQDFTSAVTEAFNILVKGEFTGIGPWAEDSKIVDRLFNIREAVKDFVTGVIEAYNILVRGDFTGIGPWEEDSKIVDFFFDIREGAQKAAKFLGDFGAGVIGFSAIIAESIFNGKNPLDDKQISDKLSNIKVGLKELGKTFSDVGGAISESWSILTDGVFTGKGPWAKNSIIVSWLYKVRDGFKAIGDYLGSLNISITPIINGFKDFFSSIVSGFNWVVEKVKGVGKAISDALPSGNKLLAGGFIAGMITMVTLAVKAWWELKDVFLGWGKIGNGISETLEGIGDALNGFSLQLKAQALVTAAIAIGLLAGTLYLLSKIDGDKITGSLIALVTVMSALIGGMKIIDQYDISGGGMRTALTMVGIGLAVMVMASALKKISELNMAEIGKGIVGLIGIMGTLSGAFILMSKFGGAKVGASALQIIAIAVSLHLLISVIKKLADMKPEQLKKGITALGAMLIELGLFFALAGRTKFNVGATLGMLAVGKAIKNIVSAIDEISKIDEKAMKSGLKTIAIILTEIVAFAWLAGKTGLFAAGAGMLLVAAAITALLVPISILGHMKIETLTKGIGALAFTLLAIGTASMMMRGMMAAGAGLMLLAIAMTMLMGPIGIFAAMGWKNIVTGVLGFAMALAVIGGVAALLGLAATPMLLFGAAVALIGIAMMAAGLGMSLFATGLVTLATMGSAAITTIVATLGTLILGMISLIPSAVDFIVRLTMQILKAITDNIPKIGALLIKMAVMIVIDIVIAILEAVVKNLPKIMDLGAKIITKFLDGMSQHLPEIVDSAANLMVTFVDSIATALEKHGPKFMNAVLRLLKEVSILFIQTGVIVADALFGWIPGVSEAASKVGKTAQSEIEKNFDAMKLAEEKGDEFKSGLESKTKDAKTAGEKIGKASGDGASSTSLSTVGAKKGDEFATALSGKSSSAKTAGTSLATSGQTGASSISLSSTGENFGAGFAQGIEKKSTMDKVVSAAKGIAKIAKGIVDDWLDINSPSREMEDSGGWFSLGFAKGIVGKTKQVASSAKDLAMTAKDSLNQFLEGFELPDGDNELHFKAVVDYEAVDPSRFGRINPVSLRPNLSFTNGLASSVKTSKYVAPTVDTSSSNKQNEQSTTQSVKQPAVIQVVTPEKRELARWLVDDITDFQDFKIARSGQF